MLSEVLKNESLFRNLYEIDLAKAKEYRQKKCPHCQGPLHYANYMRKPRGEPEGLPEEFFIQFSLCCGKEGCRIRLPPPTCRFLGKKVYWFAVILAIVSDWQNEADDITLSKFAKKNGISRNTLNRWISFFKDVFPTSPQWKKIRGKLSAVVKNDGLPASLVNYYNCQQANMEQALISCLKFLSQGLEISLKIRDG